MDQMCDRYSTIKKELFKKENLKNESDTRCQSNNQKWFDQRFNNSIQMSQWPVYIKLIPLLTKIIKNILSYSKGVQKKSVKDGIENEKRTIFSVRRKMKEDGCKGLKVQSCIFLVSKSHGFLGVSADGRVSCETPPPPLGLVEVKNTWMKEKGLVTKMTSLTRATFITTKFNNNVKQQCAV